MTEIFDIFITAWASFLNPQLKSADEYTNKNSKVKNLGNFPTF